MAELLEEQLIELFEYRVTVSVFMTLKVSQRNIAVSFGMT